MEAASLDMKVAREILPKNSTWRTVASIHINDLPDTYGNQVGPGLLDTWA